MSQSTLTPGMVIQGRYELRKLLGQGGMGSVWVAWHRGLRVEVALKFIDAPGANTEDLLNRFSHEAGVVARIRSPHVVSVMDHGFDEEHQLPFLAMELLVGEDLLGRIEREQRLPLRETVEIIRQGLRGLAKVHEAGIVHRDIKPDNLFLCQDDELTVKLLDFGIAKADLGQSAAQRTGAGAILGTPTYMSPEQARGTRAVDHRSDLYSMGVVAFHALIGQPPFESVGLGELLLMITSSPTPSPRALRDEISPALEAWFQRALAKAPEDRFQTAREMSQALVATQEGEAPSETYSRQRLFASLPESLLASSLGTAAAPPQPPAVLSPAVLPPAALPPADLSPAEPLRSPPAPTLHGATVSATPAPPPRLLGWVLAGGGVGAVLLAGAIGLSRMGASRDGAASGPQGTLPVASANTAASSPANAAASSPANTAASSPASAVVPPPASVALEPSAAAPVPSAVPPPPSASVALAPIPTAEAHPASTKATGRTKAGGASTRAPIDDLNKLNITRK